MKKATMFLMMALTQSILAGGPSADFTALNCKISGTGLKDYQQKFELNLKFSSKISTVNDSGLAKVYKDASLEMKYLDRSSNTVKTVIQSGLSLGQQTSAYGYEFKLGGAILGSEYASYLSLQPKKAGGKVIYDGQIDINAKLSGMDIHLITANGMGLGVRCELK